MQGTFHRVVPPRPRCTAKALWIVPASTAFEAPLTGFGSPSPETA